MVYKPVKESLVQNKNRKFSWLLYMVEVLCCSRSSTASK